ncbi:hypothetical protein [Mycobacterium neumannii]|uniref:hypothetical protein n=1 Tax=Mycobacterium neumannii TaxID=2048551 RepID=UPI003AB1C784
MYLVECLAQQPCALDESVPVQPHHRQSAQRFGAQRARGQLFDGLGEDGRRALLFSSVEVVQCRAQPPLRGAPAEADGQVHQLGRRGRSTAHPRRFRRPVEGLQRDLVAFGGGQRQVSSPEFGFVDDLGEPPVHRPAAAGGRLGVDPAGQQRMREPDPVTVDSDDALALGDLEQFDQPVLVARRRLRHELDRRHGKARSGQQRVVDVGVEAAEPRAHHVGQGARQRRVDARCPFIERTGQFDCVERVPARHLVDPADGGA